MSATASGEEGGQEKDLRYVLVLQHSEKHSVSQYLAVGEDRKADGALFSQHSPDKFPVMGLFYSLHYIFK